MDTQLVQRVLASVASNVRRIRLTRGWTQERLAELAEVEPRTIQHLETGKANPTIGLVATVADALGVRASTLLRQAELRPRPVGRPRRRRPAR